MLSEQVVAINGNPQIEDGYTKVANELLDAIIKHDFSKRQLKIVLFVLRKTYGFNKKTDQMSISQISAGTGLEHSATVKSIAELVFMGVVSKQHGHYAQVIGLNKKYNSWGVVSKQHPSVKTTIKGVSKRHLSSVNLTPTKETTKEIPKERRTKSFPINFQASENNIKFAHENNINLDFELEQFKSHHASNGKKFVDWNAALRTWLGNCIKFSKGGVKPKADPFKGAI